MKDYVQCVEIVKNTCKNRMDCTRRVIGEKSI